MNENTIGRLYADGMLDVSDIKNKRLDVCYGPDIRHRVDIYYPETGGGPFPLILFFNGGAFIKGDKRRYQLKAALSGIRRGYAVAGVNYRLAPEHPLPAAFTDAYRVLAWVKENAEELKIDPNRIGVWGESAGAGLACMVGLHPDARYFRHLAEIDDLADLSVSCVVDWYAPLDLNCLTSGNEEIRKTLTGTEGAEAEQIFGLCDPSKDLKEDIPPVRIEHGTADEVVPIDESIRLYSRLRKILPMEQVQINILEDAKHGVHDFENEENVYQVFCFLDRFLYGRSAVR